MAEALCGPSNPLQNVQKYASVDRTLQQDRLVAHQAHQTQGFRSSPGPLAGHLDAEFDAFHSSTAIDGGLPEHNLYQSTKPEPFVPSLNQQPLPAWASDFRQLNINDVGSSPLPSSYFRHEAPLQRNAQGDWHQEWQAKQAQKSQSGSVGVRLPATLGQTQSTFKGMGWQQHPYLGFQSEFLGTGSQLSPIALQKQAEQNVEPVFNEEAFERAFEAATLEVSRSQTNSVSQAQHNEQATVNESLQPKLSDSTKFDFDAFLRNRDEEAMEDFDVHHSLHEMNQNMMDTFDFGSVLNDIVPPDFGVHDNLSSKTPGTSRQPEQQRENLSSNQDTDELSRTAGELLEKVQHDRSEKFRDSKFLALMRQLRDKEVRVEGEKMVHALQPLHPGGEHYPEGAAETNKQATVTDDPAANWNLAYTSGTDPKATSLSA